MKNSSVEDQRVHIHEAKIKKKNVAHEFVHIDNAFKERCAMRKKEINFNK